MNKTIYSKYDKKRIPDLPRAVFEGRIIVILTPGEAERAVDYLLSSDILGFDTETRPSFRKGHQYIVSLLQVSNRHTCFLFRLNRIGLCPAIKRLLAATGIKKIGLSWHDDVLSLRKRGDLECNGFYELQDHVSEIGIRDMSLAKIFANLFSQRISKREQLSNWEVDVLSQKQKEYAATDAWACIKIYEELQRLKHSGEYYLEVVPEPEPEVKPQKVEDSQEQKKSAEAEKDSKPSTRRKSESKPKRQRKTPSTKQAEEKARKPKAARTTKSGSSKRTKSTKAETTAPE